MTNPAEGTSQDPPTHAREPASGSPFEHTEEPPPRGLEESQLAFEVAKEWVRQNQTIAMIGAFAVGSFVGAMMRD